MKIRPFYTYYVAHIIRQYFAEAQPSHPTRAYMNNYECAARVLGALSEKQRRVLKDVYFSAPGDNLSARVDCAAKRHNIDRTAIWNLMSDTEREIARARELI